MARTTLLVQCLLLLTSIATAFRHGVPSNDPTLFVPNSYIVEVDGTSAALGKRGLNAFKLLDHVLLGIKGQGIRYTIKQTFKDLPEVFHGASIQVPDGTSIDDLRKVDGVKNVWPVRILRRPDGPIFEGSVSVDSPALSAATSRLAKRATQFPPASAYRNDTFTSHVQTGVDKLHNAGILGAGIKIAVLDDGVDYTNPILGGCFGRGCHISFGYDFVGDDFTGENTPVPKEDVYSTCANHGSHVTGIIGALANEYGFSGVAPQAELGQYRVIGCEGFTSEDVLVQALMRGYRENVNIMSLSIAGGIGWLDISPSQILIEFLTSKNIHVVVASGNDGTEGLFFADSPAATIGGTAVGSVDVAYHAAYGASLLGKPSIPYQSPTPFNETNEYTLYFTSTDPTLKNDACTALPANTPDLSRRAVVVQRGTCDFNVKLANIGKAGGKIVLVYNSAGALAIPQLNVGTTGLSHVGSLRREDGLQLLKYYQAQPRGVRISFPFTTLVPYVADTVSGGVISTFSNYGPTNDLFGVPSVVAPGLNILSTVVGGLGIMRGSSMACPFVAGATALILSARASENLTPQQVKSLLMTTSQQTPTAYGGQNLVTAVRQGAGLVQVDQAVSRKTLISPSIIQLNDTAYFNASQPLTVTNKGDSPMTYTLSWTNAQGVATYNNGASNQIIPSTSPAAVNAATALRVAYSARTITLQPGQSRTVNVNVIPPNLTPTDIDKFPFYSGWLKINALSSNESYSVPFFGLGAKMIDMPILDTTDVALGPKLPFIAAGEDIATGPATYSTSDPPIVYFRLAAGTRRLAVDLVNADIDYNATVPAVTNPAQRLVKRSTNDLSKRATPTNHDEVSTIGSLYAPPYAPARDYLVSYSPAPFSDYEIPVSTYTKSDNTNASVALNTPYRVLVRALKITADPKLSNSYESWLSPSFTFTS
ncbi:uncharacterized protein JCM6883_004034 [Sporobolomyces salmoneus]|uniref:uncharacterized protein n=1 Tax=Sporobolomyces salmoneus TaxID=183962 RepID=UPI0031756461